MRDTGICLDAASANRDPSDTSMTVRHMRVAGLFSGIGGFELGLSVSGCETRILCEIDPGALAVLGARFPDVQDVVEDVAKLDTLPRVDLLVAGFPCINLSLAGSKEGLHGQQSSLVWHVFRLLAKQRVPTVVLENVPFMLHLDKGEGMRVLLREFEALGYRWAYRVVDALGFGLPQRRERVFFVASRSLDPRAVLFADSLETAPPIPVTDRRAVGFYWTEGIRGIGWADEAVPTLKGGSTVGIPSPPAIWVEREAIWLPDIRDAERMQGFEADWTAPAEEHVKRGHRWKLVGNAVSVPVIEWIGRRLREPGEYEAGLDGEMEDASSLPKAAWGDKSGRFVATRVTKWASRKKRQPLMAWLEFAARPLSEKAARGLLDRTRRSRLNFRPGFLEDLASHAQRQARASMAS